MSLCEFLRRTLFGISLLTTYAHRHYPRIGKEAIGTQITDWIYDAWRKNSPHSHFHLKPSLNRIYTECRALAANEDEAEREKTLTNADTYVWYALVSSPHLRLDPFWFLISTQHIAFEEICGKSFSGPRDERDDDATNQDWPDSDPDTDDPTNGACDCDENSCSPDSYACCANGSCQ